MQLGRWSGIDQWVGVKRRIRWSSEGSLRPLRSAWSKLGLRSILRFGPCKTIKNKKNSHIERKFLTTNPSILKSVSHESKEKRFELSKGNLKRDGVGYDVGWRLDWVVEYWSSMTVSWFVRHFCGVERENSELNGRDESSSYGVYLWKIVSYLWSKITSRRT